MCFHQAQDPIFSTRLHGTVLFLTTDGVRCGRESWLQDAEYSDSCRWDLAGKVRELHVSVISSGNGERSEDYTGMRPWMIAWGPEPLLRKVGGRESLNQRRKVLWPSLTGFLWLKIGRKMGLGVWMSEGRNIWRGDFLQQSRWVLVVLHKNASCWDGGSVGFWMHFELELPMFYVMESEGLKKVGR